MKLSPPASSSDLEAAREIARRLHQRRRREDRPESGGAAPARPQPPAPVYEPPPPRIEPVVPERPAPAPARLEPPAPEPPGWDEPAEGAEETIDPLAGFGEPSEPDLGDEAPPLPGEEPGVSPEEMVGAPEPPRFEDLPSPPRYSPEPSPFEVELDETGAPSEGAYDAPLPPSWEDIVDSCLSLAQARAALIVDPAGQLLSARGEWPEPGPSAIATKLVATMERTLKDAPTRSISAPLMGMHLTAWRVPVAEGLVTAAFIGDAPVRAEARPTIDTEIHRAFGA